MGNHLVLDRKIRFHRNLKMVLSNNLVEVMYYHAQGSRRNTKTMIIIRQSGRICTIPGAVLLVGDCTACSASKRATGKP